MSTAERKLREKEQRRAAIIDAAERVFNAKGYANATIEDIAKEAELAKGTFYLYFDNKESLYLKVIMRGVLTFEGMLDTALGREKTGVQKMRAACAAIYEFSKQYPQYYDISISWYTLPYPELVAMVWTEMTKNKTGYMVVCLEALKTGIKDGSIRPDLNPALTWLFLFESTTSMIGVLRVDYLFKLNPGLTQDTIMNFTIDRLIQSIENTDNTKNKKEILEG